MARRKRKKTEKSPRKRRRRSLWRKLLPWLLILLLIAILLPIIGSYHLLSWLQGDSFRERLTDTLANKAQAAEVAIPENLQINNERLSLPAATLRRADILQQVTARRIVADITRGRLFHRELLINKLTVEDASVRLDTAALDAPLPPVRDIENGIWRRFIPERFILNNFECTDADIELIRAGSSYSLTGCKITAAPTTRGNMSEWQVTLENGRVHTPLSYLQTCSIKNATLLFNPRAIILSDCSFMLTPGEMRLKGSYLMRNREWYQELRVNKANVERLLNNDWRRHISGELFGEAKFTGTGDNLHEARGTLSLQKGELEELPILSELTIADTRPYRTIAMEKAECNFSFPYSNTAHNIDRAWLFDRIDVRAAEDTIRVRGHVIIGQDRSLRGTLTVGIRESTLASISSIPPQFIENLFTAQGEAGYRWVNINLSGTTDNPQEDLSARVRALLIASVPEAAANTTAGVARTATGLLGTLFSTPNQEKEPENDSDSTEETPPAPLPSASGILDIIF
ncbi:MAG: hypothetical protein IKJ58_02420 [Akkermansia sp.]|nr:hypothetical protein [Akkermansia sp.]